MAGVGQPIGKFAVICKKQKTFRIHIQTSNGIHPCAAIGNQLGSIGSALFVRQGGNKATGLV
jgi:hypothetical protein